jgi:hypothetical protein
MPPLKNPQHIQIFNGMIQFYSVFIKKIVAIMAFITKMIRIYKFFFGEKNIKRLGN